MGISFNIANNNNSVINTTNYQKANVSKQPDYTYKTTADTAKSPSNSGDIEGERFLNRMKMSKTRLDTLSEYLSAMQDAQKEPGIFNMFQKVNDLSGIAKDYQGTEEYKGKKNTDTFVSDQINAMNKKFQELMAMREAQKEKDGLLEKDQVSVIDDNTTTREDVSDKPATSQTDTKVTSASNNPAEQLKAAQTYKKFDPTYQAEQILNGFM